MSHFAVQRAPAGVGSLAAALEAAAEDDEESSVAYVVAASSTVGRSVRSFMLMRADDQDGRSGTWSPFQSRNYIQSSTPIFHIAAFCPLH